MVSVRKRGNIDELIEFENKTFGDEEVRRFLLLV